MSKVKDLYKHRWDVGLNFRHIKTTLGMDRLRAETPTMVEKELWTYLLAYNLIRWLMLASAKLADVLPWNLSFQHSQHLLSHWQMLCPVSLNTEELIESMLWLITQHRVGKATAEC